MSIDVIYKPIPNISVSTSWDEETCVEEKAYIDVDVINNDYDFGGDLEFEWTLPNGKTQITTEPRLEISEKGTYTVRALTPLVCESEPSSLTVNIKPSPIIKMTTNWSQDECITADAYIDLEVENEDMFEEGTINFVWTLPDGSTFTTQDSRFEVKQSGEYSVIAVSEFACESSVLTMNIEYYEVPKFSLNSFETCEGDSEIIEVDLSESNLDPNDLTYTWYQNGKMVQSGSGIEFKTYESSLTTNISSAIDLNYRVTVETANGCSATEESTVTYYPAPVFSLGEDIEKCDIEVRILKVDVEDADEIVWSNGKTGKMIAVTGEGEFWATVYKNGCSYTDTILIENKKFPDFEIKVVAMDCDSKVVELTVDFPDEDGIFYQWSTGETTRNIKVNSGGDYSVVLNQGGCNIAKNIYLKNQYFENNSDYQEVLICKGDTVVLDTGLDFEKILWNNGETTPSISVTETGYYTATITNELFCNDVIVFDVKVSDGPEIINLDVNDEYISFDIQNGFAPYTMMIDSEEIYSKVVSNNFAKGDHVLTVYDAANCETMATFHVEDPIFVMDLFSPNDDGHNDSFTIEDLKKYPKSEVRIYDRFGRLMHKSPGTKLNWDGRFNGNLVPATDYWYHIDLFADGRFVYTGHFALIR